MFMYSVVFQLREVSDGTSNTIFVGEVRGGDRNDEGQFSLWSYGSRLASSLRSPVNPINHPLGLAFQIGGGNGKAQGTFASNHPGGAHFAFGDGHVAFISENIDGDTYWALSTRAMGETISEADF